jgi:hypothetical protein
VPQPRAALPHAWGSHARVRAGCAPHSLFAASRSCEGTLKEYRDAKRTCSLSRAALQVRAVQVRLMVPINPHDQRVALQAARAQRVAVNANVR